MIKNKRMKANPGLFSFTKLYWKRLVGLCLLTVVQSLLQVAMALLFRYVIDAALGAKETLAFWGWVLVADMLALVGVHAFASWCAGSTADYMTAKLRQKLLRSVVFSRDETLLGRHSGELLSRGMEDVHTVCDGTVSTLPTLTGQITRLIASFAAIVYLSPMVAAVLVAAALVVGVGVACIRPVLKAHHRAVRQSDEKVMSTMQEDLQHAELILSLGAQQQILKRFDLVVKQNLKTRLKRRFWSVGSSGIVNAMSHIGIGGMLLWGAAQVAAKTISYGTLTAMLQLFSMFRGPVLGLSGVWTRLAAIEVAADRLWEFIAPEQEEAHLDTQPTVEAIVFEDVTFAYPGDEAPVLNDFSFRFLLNDWTCLTGVSGKGKSTIFKLILGLYAPQKGKVYLQTDIGEIPCTEASRQLFAYVPQDYSLFSGTILENLQLVAPDLDENKLRQVIAAAQADFVWDLTEKERTQVLENNAGLSKGQLQRLAIARAILMDRPIFLLDECTSALDAQTEEAVLVAMHKLGKQAILVTHRPEVLSSLGNITQVSLEK